MERDCILKLIYYLRDTYDIILKMHILQPKQRKLKPDEVEKLTKSLNISLAQLPKIKIKDPSLVNGCEVSDVMEIERIVDGKKTIYYRVVSV